MALSSLLREHVPPGLRLRPTLASVAVHVVVLGGALVVGATTSERPDEEGVRLTFYDVPPDREGGGGGGGSPREAAPARVESPAPVVEPIRRRRIVREPAFEVLEAPAPETSQPTDLSENPYDGLLPVGTGSGTGTGTGSGTGTGTGTGTGAGTGTGSGSGAGTGAGPDTPTYLAAGMIRPRLLRGEPPRYTEQARRAGVETDVVVRIEIAKDGRVRDVRILRGHPFLDADVVRTVRRWVFAPALRRGEPVSVYVVQRIEFSLER